MLPEAAVTHRYRLVLLLVLSANLLLDALEVSIAVVSLPSLRADLHLSIGAAQWVVSGFAAGFGVLLPFASWIAARVGRRRSYLVALLVFAAASVLSGLSGDVVALAATRVVTGCCAALTAPTGLAIIASAFTEAPERNRAVSVYTFFGACGFSVGLLGSGLLTEASWRWTLLSPAPVAAVLFLIGLRVVPADPPGRTGGRPAFRRVLANPALRRSALGAASLNGSYWGFLLVVTFRIQAAPGWSPLRTGLALLPASLPLAASALSAGRMVARFGPARLIALGAAAPPLAYALCLPYGDRLPYLTVLLPALLLVAAGFVLAFTALHVQANAGVPDADRPAASGLYQASVQLGGCLAVWLVAALLGTGRLPAMAAITAITAISAAGALLAFTGVARHIAR